MDNFSALRDYTSRLYRKSGHLKLYFHFHCELQDFEAESLKLEIEKIKQIISEIENKIEKL